jgi:hypothetical protein
MERRKAEDPKVIPGRAQKALRAGPHGSQIHSDGSTQASANQHKSTSGGDGNAVTQFGESYRIGQHAIPHSEKKDLPPKPGKLSPVAINLDSSYENPKGPATTRASKSSDGVAAVPTAGGNVRAGKDVSDPCDAHGNPEKHHGGPAEEAKVVSGRGPAAAKKQVGEITAKYPKSSAGYN